MNSSTFWLAGEGGFDPPRPGPESNGLVNAARGVAAVLTWIHTGLVHVAVAVLPEPPDSLDATKEWEEIAELSVSSDGRPLGVVVLGADVDESLQEFTKPEQEGWHRLRVYALGRDIQPDGVAFEPREFYLVEVWPEAFERQGHIYRQTDARGNNWRISAARNHTDRT